jgi:hypothetical protein
VGPVASRLDANQEEMKAMLDACLEKMEANPEEQKSVAVHEEIPKEEAAGETFGALKKRHEDRYLAVGRRRKPKKRTQGNGGSRKKSAATLSGMTCHAGVVWRKGHGRQGHGQYILE